MEYLSPVRRFLRVGDKFMGMFAMHDMELGKGATLVYLYLFWDAARNNYACPTQEELAEVSKSSVRSVQGYIKELVDLEYIRVERRGKRNVYRLLLSERVKSMISKLGIEMITQADAVFVQRMAVETAPVACTSTRAKTARIEPDIGADSARLYIKKKDQEKISPLSPLPKSPTASPAVGVAPCRSPLAKRQQPEGGNLRRVACVPSTHHTVKAFERLFAAWPFKQDKLACAKVYQNLARANKLPDIDVLLSTVERFKAEDRRWQSGYVPNLKFWLLGARWNDEPVPALSARYSKPLAVQVIADVTPRDLELQRRVHALQRSLESAPTASTKELSPTALAETLCTLWSGADRGQVQAGIGLARVRGATLSNLLERAREYMTGLAGATPLPVSEWLRTAAVQ